MRLFRTERSPRGHRARRSDRVPFLELIEPRVLLASFTVTSVADDGAGSLRQVITSLDQSTDTANRVSFAIGRGTQIIALKSPLPPITVPVFLDGTSQPGYSGKPLVRLEGTTIKVSGDGLTLASGSGGSTIQGLAISGFLIGSGISVQSDGNLIQGDSLGGFPDYNGEGLTIDSSYNSVGGLTDFARNVISGNIGDGVVIEGRYNELEGNYIGVDFSGGPGTNQGNGVLVGIEGNSNTIGGSTAAARNIIAGNLKSGIDVVGAETSIQGNYIGIGPTGESTAGNGGAGVLIEGPNNVVGGAYTPQGPVPGLGNVISGNFRAGVEVTNGGFSCAVGGNFIGTNASGTSTTNVQIPGFPAFRTTGNLIGVLIDGDATGNTIGGTIPAWVNVISGNSNAGVEISGLNNGFLGVNSNIVEGNYIGTDYTGNASRNTDGSTLGNGTGVLIENQPVSNTVGGTAPGSRNIIMSNYQDGVEIAGALANALTLSSQNQVLGNLIAGNFGSGAHLSGPGATGCLIAGNTIGLDANGNLAGNLVDGVLIDKGAFANTIGGSLAIDPNIMAGNGEAGLHITDGTTKSNAIQGNFIGTDSSSRSLGNGIGVLINDANGNTIGGTTGGPMNTANVIGWNGVGIELSGLEKGLTGNNAIIGNCIGVSKPVGGLPIGNQYGIWINDVPNAIIGGAARGQGNTIADNTLAGVYISGPDAIRNQIEGNSILGPNSRPSTNKRTKTDPSNPFPIGVFVENSSSNTIGGAGAGAGNTISGNTVGVYIVGARGSSAKNQVMGNHIGLSTGGGPGPGNLLYGVILVNAPNNSVPQSGPAANRIIGSGIANYREYSGPISTTPGSTTRGKSASTTKKPPHHANRGMARSQRRTAQHAQATVHGHNVPEGPLRKTNDRGVR
jgi:hypothetical protein